MRLSESYKIARRSIKRVRQKSAQKQRRQRILAYPHQALERQTVEFHLSVIKRQSFDAHDDGSFALDTSNGAVRAEYYLELA